LCDSKNHKKRKGSVRDSAPLSVLECKSCSFVFLSANLHTDEAFYKEGNMHGNLNVETWLETTKKDDHRRFESLKKKIKDKNILDFGCGNGGFLRLARNAAKKAEGIELQENLQNYFIKNNLKVYKNINQTEEKYDYITLFHVIEHLASPKKMLAKLAQNLSDGGEIIIETPNSDDVLLKAYKNKGFSNFTYWSCHPYLFNEKTLKKLVEDSGFKVTSFERIQRYGLVNHLYWLIFNKPGGHKKWARFDFGFINFIYGKILSLFKMTDTIVIKIRRSGFNPTTLTRQEIREILVQQ